MAYLEQFITYILTNFVFADIRNFAAIPFLAVAWRFIYQNEKKREHSENTNSAVVLHCGDEHLFDLAHIKQ